MDNDHDSSNSSPIPATSSRGGPAIKPSVHPVPTAGNTPVFETEVEIADLIIDPGLQLRAKPHDPKYIDDLVDAVLAGKLKEPISAFKDTEGLLRLADGHARVAATKKAGKDSIRARVYAGGHHDAFVCALGANATHGARRTREDLHNAVKAALSDPEMMNWSNVQIGEVCACSDPFVGKVRRALASNDAATPTHRRGKDGKQYPATRNIPASASNGSSLTPPKSAAAESRPTVDHAPAVGVSEVEAALEAVTHETPSPKVAPLTPTRSFVEVKAGDLHAADRELALDAARALIDADTKARFLAVCPRDGSPPRQPGMRAVWDVYTADDEGRPAA